MPVVRATGATRMGPKLGPIIEAAMGRVHDEVAAEAQAIWVTDLPEDERRARIAAITSDEAIRERKLAARAAVKEKYRALMTDVAAAASNEAEG